MSVKPRQVPNWGSIASFIKSEEKTVINKYSEIIILSTFNNFEGSINKRAFMTTRYTLSN